MTLRIAVDRTLPVKLSVQLKGQIEYGIVSGALKPGEQLPSVRELAAAEGIAHVTVSQVYSALRRDGLIVVRPGMGTYVADDGDGHRPGESLGELQRLVDSMVGQALAHGFTAAQISQMTAARLAGKQHRRPIVTLIGLFEYATGVYARELAAMLPDLGPEVRPCTIEALRSGDEEACERVRRADLVVTIANQVREVQRLVGPGGPPVRGIAFAVHPETVRQLRAVPREGRLGVVSTFAEFLPTMVQGVISHVAPVQAPLCTAIGDVERLRSVLAQADTLVYASGSEAILAQMAVGTTALEYLHMPEAASVAALRPLLQRAAEVDDQLEEEGA